MRYFLICFLLGLSTSLIGQKKLGKMAAKLEAEGKKLYRLEMAAWHGTDLIREKHPELFKEGGGYVSYEKGNRVHYIFYSRNGKDVLSDVSFDWSFDLKKASINLTKRPFNNTESKLYQARNLCTKLVYSDSTFTQYENTAYNFIPTFTKKGMTVYVLTGPKKHGVVILGNDFTITLDKKNRFKKVQSLHQNIIPIEFDASQKGGSSIHSHTASTSDFITPTDICTLMLYRRFTSWKHHVVISESYVSSWDFEKEKLVILTKEAWEKISK